MDKLYDNIKLVGKVKIIVGLMQFICFRSGIAMSMIELIRFIVIYNWIDREVYKAPLKVMHEILNSSIKQE